MLAGCLHIEDTECPYRRQKATTQDLFLNLLKYPQFIAVITKDIFLEKRDRKFNFLHLCKQM